MTYRVFRIRNPHLDYKWGATHDATSLRYILAPRMARLEDAKTGAMEWCFYGKTPFEALERLKRFQRRAKP